MKQRTQGNCRKRTRGRRFKYVTYKQREKFATKDSYLTLYGHIKKDVTGEGISTSRVFVKIPKLIKAIKQWAEGSIMGKEKARTFKVRGKY